nr:TIGR01906 family membrane protein [Arthrobacter roseus]
MLPRILQIFVAVMFPFIVVAASVRAVTSSVFLWLEYHRPGFPADSYGFSTDDRLTYGSYTVDYILNFASPRYLGDLVGPDGQQLFLESEVGHMQDVKMVLATGFLVALVLAIVAVVCCIYLLRRYSGGIRRALFAGAVSTLVLMTALAVTAVLGWERFFTLVHQVFFSEGTWTFRVDDTLIRLFPEQFWLDSGIVIGALVLLVSLVSLVLTWPTRRRRTRSRTAQEAARRRMRENLESSSALR